MKKALTVLFSVLVSFSIFGQTDFKGFPVQFQIPFIESGPISMKVIITDQNSDTIWHEEHIDVNIINFTGTLNIGEGIFVNGQAINFNNLTFNTIDYIKIFYFTPSTETLLLESPFYPMAYALHSKYTEQEQSVLELSDLSYTTPPLMNQLIKWNGTTFELNYDYTSDSALYSHQIGTAIYADTAAFAYTTVDYTDTAGMALLNDSSQYAITAAFVTQTDTADYADTSLYASYAINNWSYPGNPTPIQFVGTTNNVEFPFKTNNSNRLFLTDDGHFSNQSNSSTNSFQSSSLLIENASLSGSINLTDAFMYFSGGDSYFIGGKNTIPFSSDTSYLKNSFSWGENNFVKGEYSTAFGKNNTIAPSTYSGTFDGSGSLAIGRNNIAAHHGFVVGENSEAGHRRNVAMGKNAYSAVGSATVAIGTNSVSTGATATAIGNSVTADGAFSTAIGNYSSTDGYTGSFAFGDNSGTTQVKNTADHQFVVRAAGGTIFYTSSNLLSGVELAANGSGWNMLSDKNIKRNFKTLNDRKIMSKLARLDISSWNYIGYTDQHIGPMAQDFYRLFDIGENQRHINMIDMDGIVLYGISSVNKNLKSKSASSGSTEQISLEIKNEKSEFELLKARLKALENNIENE